MIRQTSLQSYGQLMFEIGDRQHAVYKLLKIFGPCTDLELVKMTGARDANLIRPRRNELVKLGLVVEVDRRKCRVSGRKAIVWCVR